MANLLPKDIDYERYLTGQKEAQHIFAASDYALVMQDYIARKHNPPGPDRLLPWSKTHGVIQLEPGEVSIWAGVNGHGKTTLLSQILLWIMPHARCLVASLEMPVEDTLNRMARQAAGCRLYTADFLKSFLDATDDNLWLYDQTETVPANRMLGMVVYAASALKIRHIVIDNLMKCGFSREDYDGPWKFIDQLTYIAKNHGCHIHVVHHMRKGEREDKIPDKFDLRGAGEIADQVDNVFIVHRNILKERTLESEPNHAEAKIWPDTHLVASKQRRRQWLGKINLWYHKDSEQFTGDHRCIPIPWNQRQEAQ